MNNPTTAAAPVQLTDGEHIIIEALKKNGVDIVYGICGIPVTDLARQMQADGIRYIGFRHEQNAGNAAAIHGFLTKKPGILLTVSAPGFLNGLLALTNATVNGWPMIQISGSSTRSIIDLQQGDYEGLDQMNVAKPLVKASYRIDNPQDIATGLARAIHAACSGRPGGVYLDITTALIEATMPLADAQATLFTPVDPAPVMAPSPESVERAMQILSKAKTPMIFLGKGAAYAQADAAIKKFIETTGIPFIPMSMAKGVLPDDHPLSAASARSYTMEHADVTIMLGARLNWMLGHGKGKHWNPNGTIIQLDIDPMEIDSNRFIAGPVVGDIGASVAAMTAALDKYPVKLDPSWMAAINANKQVNDQKMAAKLATNPQPMSFYSALNVVKKVYDAHPDVYLVNEGANTLDDTRDVVNMYLPRHRLDCGTWGEMGIGMGFAIGAATTMNKQVLCIEGDSAFGFSGMEVETICLYKLPVTIVIFNNGGIYNGSFTNLGGGTDPSPTTIMPNGRYDLMITAFGGTPYNATTPQELQAAMESGLTSGKPTLINCVINPADGEQSGHISSLNPKTLPVK